MNELLVQHTLDLITQAAQASNIIVRPKVIIGLSGGPDSVFLLLLLKQLQDKNLITLHAAHLNHGWRESAYGDTLFCRELCEKLGISLTIEHAQNLDVDIKANGSKEELGRKLRRHFFEQVRLQEKADFIMLAHHLQDQQETFFLRMVRGATLSGLCGMQPIAGIYLRPLLETRKQEMLDYLQTHGISYCTDETNESDDFLRNRIRKLVLPAMQACDERFDGNFMRLIGHLKADDLLLERLTKEAFERVFEKSYVASKAAFLHLDPQLQRRVVLYWLIQEKVPFVPTDRFLLEIIRFLLNPNGGAHQLHADWTVVKKKDLFWLEKDEEHVTRSEKYKNNT